jgi:hypothetical protein
MLSDNFQILHSEKIDFGFRYIALSDFFHAGKITDRVKMKNLYLFFTELKVPWWYFLSVLGTKSWTDTENPEQSDRKSDTEFRNHFRRSVEKSNIWKQKKSDNENRNHSSTVGPKFQGENFGALRLAKFVSLTEFWLSPFWV